MERRTFLGSLLALFGIGSAAKAAESSIKSFQPPSSETLRGSARNLCFIDDASFMPHEMGIDYAKGPHQSTMTIIDTRTNRLVRVLNNEPFTFYDVSLVSGRTKLVDPVTKLDVDTIQCEPGNVAVFQAKAAGGKTAQLIQQGAAFAKAGYRVIHVNLECRPEYLIRRYYDILGKDSEHMRNVVILSNINRPFNVDQLNLDVLDCDVLIFDYADMTPEGRIETLRKLQKYAVDKKKVVFTAIQKRRDLI
jgi:hypothetical protein